MKSLKLLDCFCGLGGVSRGFAAEGFECTGIEINPEIARLYPYKVIVADMLDLDGRDFRGYDVIWGSPPCRDFSRTTSFGWKYWRNPPNPEQGLRLVKHFLKFVEEAKPRIWIMENVPGLIKYLDIPPRFVGRLSRTMIRAFWGNFPDFLLPTCETKRLKQDIQGPYRKWKRAMIPFPVARAFARACKQKLIEEEVEEA